MINVNPGLAPHGGNQYAAVVYGYDSNRKFVAQSNWLISPRLSGRKQEVTFYVMNIATRTGDTNYAEHFDILYSTEGTDDVSYEQVSTGADDDITEYVIYRDGKKIASVKGNQQTYTNSRVSGDHVYNVTVMYTSKDGEINESGFSNDASTSATSVNSVEETPSSYDITNINGVRVRTGAKDKNGLKRGVYIINGKKCVVK